MLPKDEDFNTESRKPYERPSPEGMQRIAQALKESREADLQRKLIRNTAKPKKIEDN